MQSRDLLHSSYVWVGQFRLCSNLINGGGGVAIRMSWYTFFEKRIVGGDVYSGLESKQPPYIRRINKLRRRRRNGVN